MIVKVGAGRTATIPKGTHRLRVVIPAKAGIQALRCVASASASGQPLLRHRPGQRRRTARKNQPSASMSGSGRIDVTEKAMAVLVTGAEHIDCNTAWSIGEL